MILVFALSFSACNSDSAKIKNDETYVEGSNQSGDIGAIDDVFGVEETTEERDVVSASLTLFSDFEGTNFSEGYAFSNADYKDSSGFYFDKTGEVKFLLDTGYHYGYMYSEGYAVISNKDKDNYLWDLEDAYSAVIDKNGKYLFNGGEHNFYGKVSEGKIIAYDYVESYKGTVIVVTAYDIEKNKLWSTELDRIPSFGSFYLDGIVAIGNRCYDEKGNVVFETDVKTDLLNAFSEDSYVCVIEGTISSLRVFNRKELKIEEYSFPYAYMFPDKDFAGMPFKDDCFIQYFYGSPEKMYKMDINGNLTPLKGDWEHVVRVTQTGDGTWILELKNGFHTLIDENGQFLFEPVQMYIHYLGEGLYQYGDGRVKDKTGKEIFDLGKFDGTHYYDGMMIAMYSNTDRYYVDKEGNKLTKAWSYLDVLYG